MIDFFKQITGSKKGNRQAGGKKEREQARIALCVLLLEAAHADGKCSAEEMASIRTTLMNRFGVSGETIDYVLSESAGARDEAIDLFRFTRYMNNHYSKVEKVEAMEAVWQVILTDGHLEAHEDHFAHKLANLLRLTHRELIAAKQAARVSLSEN